MKYKSIMFFHSIVWKLISGMGYCVINIHYIEPRIHFREILVTKSDKGGGGRRGFKNSIFVVASFLNGSILNYSMVKRLRPLF